MNEIDNKIERLIDQQSMHGKSPDLSEHDDQQQLQFELQLQKKIDAALGRKFPSEPVSESEHQKKIEALVSDAEETSVTNLKSPDRRAMLVRALVLAASVLILIGVLMWFFKSDSPSIRYNRAPLAKLYKDTVDRGFKPYYDCSDPVRFANQFESVLGVPLRLAEMPEHKQMVGLTFVGGVSRKTTSMLGLVNDQPVLVFVDILGKDDEEMQAQVGKSEGCNIFRTTKDGLVYYEVSGYEESQLIEYFEKTDSKMDSK